MRTKREVRKISDDQAMRLFGGVVGRAMEWEYAKQIVIPKLMDCRESEYLKDKPHTRIADLPVVYNVPISSDGGMYAAIAVKDNLLEMWGVSQQELHEAAVGNLKTVVKTLPEVMLGLGHPLLYGVDEPVLYVLTNEAYHYGAANVLDAEAMNELCELFDGEIALIPSSIHEWLVFDSRDADAKAIGNMIKMVNATSLEEDDILSDKLYIYSPEKGLMIA